MTGKATFITSTPLVPTGPASLAEALAFYRDQLGFAVTWQSDTMAGLQRGAVTLNLVVNSEPMCLVNASFSIGVDDLDALFAEYHQIPARIGPLEMKPWGRREFHMIVPSGVCLQFYRA
ncbi:MAG: hypothetical protein HY255_01285 [Betaproteobacteria bacterium]|nr:hypothetical protein [Betaproteobacteria bacterium]